MDSVRRAVRRTACVALALATTLGAGHAHKLKAFATAEGPLVSGYAYFAPGGRAQQADVTVTGPGGVEVLKTGVNEQGEFHFTAKQRVDYTIAVDGGDAHVASFTIHAGDLPDTLPAPTDGTILPLDPPGQASVTAPAGAGPSPQADATAPPGAAATGGLVVADPATLRAMIRESVAREVNPLREQLDAFQAQVGWRDVVSGIGYIFGLSGVAYFFATWRSNRKTPAASALQTQRRA